MRLRAEPADCGSGRHSCPRIKDQFMSWFSSKCAATKWLALISAALVVQSRSGLAQTVRQFSSPAPVANWNAPANWLPVGVPGNGDTANIPFGDFMNHTVLYDYTGAAVTLNSLTIDSNPGLPYPLFTIPTITTTLSMAGNTLSATTEFIGSSTFAPPGLTSSVRTHSERRDQ